MNESTHRSTLWRVALALGLVGVLVYRFDWSLAAEHLSWRMLIAVALVQPVQLASVFLVTLRFSLLVQARGAPLWQTFKAYVLSIGLNALLPGRVAEILKVSYLRDHAGVSIGAGLAAIVLERITDVFFLGLFILLGLGGQWFSPNLYVVGAGLLAIAGLLRLLPVMEPRILRLLRLIPAERIRKLLHRVLHETALRVAERKYYGVLALSLAAWVANFAVVDTVIEVAGSIRLSWSESLAVFAAIVVGRAIPALPGGLGTYEAAAVFALRRFGYSFEEALTLALASHISQLLPTLAGALVIMTKERLGLRELALRTRRFFADPGTPGGEGPAAR